MSPIGSVASSPTPDSKPSLLERAPEPKPLEPDGNDEGEEPGSSNLTGPAHFELVGQPPLALQRICDLTVIADQLFATHAVSALGSDGATVSRFRADQPKTPFQVAFDWNRPGEPSRGGGAGQGFLRARALSGRLFVPDADPPYYGFWLSHTSPEGFVFVSDSQGDFARARRPGYLPPAPPSETSKSGAGILPGAYHVLDVIRFRDHYYASTGAVPRGGHANQAEAPGVLYVADPGFAHWQHAAEYPHPAVPGVTRLTFLVRFRDRLYAGVQDFDARGGIDYVYWAPPPDVSELRPEDMHAVRATEDGAAATYRWYADRGQLYWISATRSGVALRRTADGEHWIHVPLPSEFGPPTDIVRFGPELFVLTEWALLRLDERGAHPVAHVRTKRSPFQLGDYFCAAPLVVYRNQIYAGGQDRGRLYRVVEGDAPADPTPK
ncbi:MAG TPA: hypothetical protein VFQ61_26295 [Polyangiaceae bacterium]|nr:hypothetical protein [Polyangiaceae bacterium]